MRRLWLLVGLLAVVGCDEAGKGVSPDRRPPVTRKESQPALTMDRQYIYYVNDDTVNPVNSGVYRARVNAPEREAVLYGRGWHSPTVSLTGGRLACLDSTGSIYYYSPADKSLSGSAITERFASITFVNDTLLVGERAGGLSLVNEVRRTVTLFTAGWDATCPAVDKFVCVARTESHLYHLVQYADFSPVPETLLTLWTMAVPRWPSMEGHLRRLAFTLQSSDGIEVHTAAAGEIGSTFICNTWHVKPYMIDFNLLIFAGPDGRFYRADFDGESIFPWWHAVLPG
ncbi:MAG: hypothetical protein OEW00_11670 [candidate division Zixibacteria bacterium]|nr:hypothetical protein [candidate division Zixibacteria bacterium]